MAVTGKTPLVSIIISCYNQEGLITSAINSVLNQTYSNIEIIVVDDHSLDSSWLVLEEIAKNNLNVTIYRNKANHGIAYTRSKGFKLANGEFVSYLDGDDTYLKTKVYVEVNHLIMHPHYDLVFSDFHITQSGKTTRKWSENKDLKPSKQTTWIKKIITNEWDYRYEMIRNSALNKMNVLYDTTLQAYEDWEFRIRYIQLLKPSYINEVTSIYQLNPKGLSHTLSHKIAIPVHIILNRHFFLFMRSGKINKYINLYYNNLFQLILSKHFSKSINLKLILLSFIIKPWKIGRSMFLLKNILKAK
jgi:glycosyltransferase involved in cell wall biosynthesis